MRGIALLLVTAAAGAALARGEPLRGVEFDDGRVRVQMPGMPKVETKHLATAVGAVPVTTGKVDAGKELVLGVSVAIYPDGFKDLTPKAVIDGVVNGLKGADGRVTKDEDTSVGDGPDKLVGRAVRIDAGRNAIRARVFLDGHRLYQVMASGSRDVVDGKAAEAFLNSFELVK